MGSDSTKNQGLHCKTPRTFVRGVSFWRLLQRLTAAFAGHFALAIFAAIGAVGTALDAGAASGAVLDWSSRRGNRTRKACGQNSHQRDFGEEIFHDLILLGCVILQRVPMITSKILGVARGKKTCAQTKGAAEELRFPARFPAKPGAARARKQRAKSRSWARRTGLQSPKTREEAARTRHTKTRPAKAAPNTALAPDTVYKAGNFLGRTIGARSSNFRR